MARGLTDEDRARGRAVAKAKRESFFRAQHGRIRLQEYEFGVQLFLNRPDAWYFSSMASALSTRKMKEFLAAHGTPSEKEFVGGLVKQFA